MDKRRTPAPDFKVGQNAFVEAQYFRSTRLTKKFSEKYLGPFEIIAQVGTHSFTLWLPESLQSVHPVFHISMLEPATLNTIPNRTQPPPPPVAIEGEPEYEISAILDSKSTNVAVANSSTWYNGPDMKVPMRNILGYPQMNSNTLCHGTPLQSPRSLPRSP